MTYSLHPGAELDIANALDFYSEQASPIVAALFLEEFERVATCWLNITASERQQQKVEELSR